MLLRNFRPTSDRLTDSTTNRPTCRHVLHQKNFLRACPSSKKFLHDFGGSCLPCALIGFSTDKRTHRPTQPLTDRQTSMCFIKQNSYGQVRHQAAPVPNGSGRLAPQLYPHAYKQILDTLDHTRERPSQNMFLFEVFTRFPG